MAESIFALDSFWLSLILKLVAVVAFFLVAPLIAGYQEHKVMAFMQNRLGPMEAGPFGALQLVADGIKFIQKEDIIPAAADKRVFSAAPGVVLIPTLIMIAVLPLSPGGFAEDLDVGIFFALAVSSVGVVGVMMAAWASASKYSLIGGIREAAQLIAYEIPLFIAAAAVVMQAGTMSLVGIVNAQADFTAFGIPVPYAVPQAIGLVIFGIAALAELNRPPFDMPIADSEVIAGHMTEYSGLRFAFFLLTEFGGMVVYSALMVVLFLGGWNIWPGVPLPDNAILANLIGFGVSMVKILGLVFVMTWLRSTYPRLREDQLQRFAWTVMIPLAILQLIVTAIGKVIA
ncbi:NADH-quinone oxidoreductase subunit NuoH [Euzebya tangerina]|uniref:NADH-quinone oxidoreductase subunit NuoH n=1 Tax=Euzebya tangerina TaxID=591198 RepID=UPI000E319739|nr:NADH-quinone oxidoreductase subunit NuoH [Euzebya tangerina]